MIRGRASPMTPFVFHPTWPYSMELPHTSATSLRAPGAWLSAASVALSSALLFVVQPMLAKTLLPLFGGSAGVWAVCMLFFQVALLLGYGYAFCLTRYCRPKTQAWVHL